MAVTNAGNRSSASKRNQVTAARGRSAATAKVKSGAASTRASKGQKAGGIGSDAVQKKTGRTWDEWVVALNRAGARELSHSEIATLVHEKFGVGDWWSQMVTVGYEQLVGKRIVGQKADGFAISVSRTLAATAEEVFGAFSDARLRARWLPESFTITTATAPKSLRILWGDGKTRLDVNIYAKKGGRSQLSLQHSKLANAGEAARKKLYWAEALEHLKIALDWNKAK